MTVLGVILGTVLIQRLPTELFKVLADITAIPKLIDILAVG